ncbi:hypothetical protein NQ314_002478, partial [Rhamnusium bicolor]
HKRGLPLIDSDGESISHPFPTVPNTDSDLGSPYENVRPSSKNARSVTTDPSPGTSPQRWDFQRHARPPEAFEDRRVSGVSGISMRNSKPYQSLPVAKRTKAAAVPINITPLDGITFAFKEKLDLRKDSTASSSSYFSAIDCGFHSNSDSSRESDNSLYQIPCAPRAFMDTSIHSEDLNYLCTNRELDQISVSSTASSCGYPRRPDSGGVPLYIPMNNPRGGHSPGSNSKVSPTPPKKPPRRNISISPTHIQPMSMSVDGVSNSAYEYLFLAHSGTRSQGNLNDFDKESRRERLTHGRSMDQYVEMNVFNIALDDDEPERPKSELQKRRHPEVYEEYDFRRKGKEEPIASSSAPETIFVSSAFIMVSDDSEEKTNTIKQENKKLLEYKRRSKDMETETEEEYLLICDESSGSFSSSVSLSDRSIDNILEEYHSDVPFAGLIKGSTTKVLENINSNTPAERPKTLKKLKRVYDNTNSDGLKSDNEKSSSSEKESENKENKERVSALSPFDEQEEWAKIQEIMASFGTGIVRESVFVAELEKEFQSRLMTISCSQNSLNNSESVTTVEKWLQGLDMDLTFQMASQEVKNGVIEENDLKEMGITSELERQILLDSIKQLSLKINEQLPTICNNNNEQNTVKLWLKKISLDQYYETFAKHLYHDMERVKRIWDVELSAVLDIEKIGHRKRILASVSSGEHIVAGPRLEEISADVNLLKCNQPVVEMPSPSTHSVNSNTGTIRHRHKKSRPAPPPPVKKNVEPEKKSPAEIFVGGSNSIKSQWRHQPILLITGYVKYSANSSKEPSPLKKSIQKVMKSKDHPSEEICLSISYRGVKFINPIAQKIICEHEIKNMNCVCQDNENQCYFAYISKDADTFYCHVFQAVSPEQAIDIILTLGQAFELAYQMALRDQVTSKSKSNRDSHKPAVSPGAVSSHSRDFKDTSTRNADVKLNGHPLKMKPLTLSIAADPVDAPHQKTPTKVNFGDMQG